MILRISYKMLFILVCFAWPCYAIANLLPVNLSTQPKALLRWCCLGILFIHNICIINFCSSNLWLEWLCALANHLLMTWHDLVLFMGIIMIFSFFSYRYCMATHLSPEPICEQFLSITNKQTNKLQSSYFILKFSTNVFSS